MKRNISDLDIIMTAVCLSTEFEGVYRAIFRDRFQMCRKTTDFSVKISGNTVDNR